MRGELPDEVPDEAEVAAFLRRANQDLELVLETDEESFLRVANIHYRRAA